VAGLLAELASLKKNFEDQHSRLLAKGKFTNEQETSITAMK